MVDDHADTREMYAEMLRASGLEPIVARDGAEALAQAAVRTPAVVITDMRLPGDVTASGLCRHFASISVPVIALTGLPPGRYHDDVRQAGCALVVMKPYPPDRLVVDIRRILAPNHGDVVDPD